MKLVGWEWTSQIVAGVMTLFLRSFQILKMRRASIQGFSRRGLHLFVDAACFWRTTHTLQGRTKSQREIGSQVEGVGAWLLHICCGFKALSFWRKGGFMYPTLAKGDLVWFQVSFWDDFWLQGTRREAVRVADWHLQKEMYARGERICWGWEIFSRRILGHLED